MQKQRLWRYLLLALLTVSVAIGGAGTALAVTSTSPHYQVTETQFNSTQQSCSGQYCAQATIGDATNGSKTVSSAAQFSDIVDNQPMLDVIIETGNSNLGVLSTQTTATTSTVVKVRSYLMTGGYILQLVGEPPKFKGHTLTALTIPTASKPGTEQFGVNVVANTTPTAGANPVQVPDGQQTFGIPEQEYVTPNKFMYVSEDVIARGVTDSGRTDYTVSMIVNISSSTPAGKYSGDFAAIVVPVY